ncbi:hypothetical protein BH23BAC3_BH23BAC3_01050 [soil metagenome]
MNKKGFIVLLLGICCLTAGILHVQIDPKIAPKLSNVAQIDSLITQTRYDFRITSDQINTRTIEIDSLFNRRVYTLKVPPGFSKTTFHHHLHNRLYPMNVQTYGLVLFPEQNMDLHIVYNRTIHRTVQLRTDAELENQPLVIPRLPNI